MTNSGYSLGDAIGRYRLIGEISRGGMGIVYIAAAHGPAGFNKLVALKELRPDLADDPDFLTMFLEEARMAARLNHPNIVQTNDVSEHEGRHFIAMEYLEGRSFYQILKRFRPRGGFPQRMALAALRDVLGALDYAHEHCGFDGKPLGFVHRDVSPHNIFITFDGHTKVIDFGIAKARDSSLETRTGVLKGRANYMAPEQLTRRSDRRSDIFSVGAVLFEILSGRRLWQGSSEVEILAALTRGEIPSLAAVRPDAPVALLAVCERALRPRADDRFATAAEMRDALDHYLWSTGGAPRPRDVAALVTQEFEAERQATRALIDAALTRLKTGESGRLELLAVPEPIDPSLTSHRTGKGSLGRAQRILSHELSQHKLTPAPVVSAADDPRLDPLFPEIEQIGGERVPFVVRHGKWVAAASLAVVFVATTLTVALNRPSAPAPEPPAPATTPPLRPAAAAPVAALAPPESIVFSVSVTPSTAEVLIDGVAMPSNPFLGHFLKGSGTHRVRAVAPGYLPKERLVTFDDNVMIDLSLNARPAAPPPPTHAPARHAETASHAPAVAPVLAPPPSQPARAAATNDIAPRNEWSGPKRRAIDTNNPYGE